MESTKPLVCLTNRVKVLKTDLYIEFPYLSPIFFYPNCKIWIQLTIGHVRYINILTWLRGLRVKIENFLSFFCLSIPKRDSNTKKTTPNIEVWPESLGAMLEYWFISYILRFSHQILLCEKAFRILLRPIREAKRVSRTWKNRFVQSQTTV